MDDIIWEKLAGKRVLVVGDYMVDRYIEGGVRRISPEAPVPVIEVRSEREVLGGAGNVINNILALGGEAMAVGCIGTDGEGDNLLSMLQARGADVSCIFRDENRPTIVKTRVVSGFQQFLRYDKEKIEPLSGACMRFFRAHEEEIFRRADIVLLSDYGKGTFTQECAQFFIQGARKRGLKVVIDPKGKDYSRYYGATVCTPNVKELKEATGSQVESEEELYAAAEKLREENGLNYVLVTRSEKGMSLIPGVKKNKDDFPALAKEVVDVTGAGDTVVSVISLALAAGIPFPQACKMANRAASVVVSKFGSATATKMELIGDSISKKEVVAQKDAEILAECLRQQGKKIVFTNGCFDILHAGHISSFRHARALGDVLIVGLNSDASVRRIKGEKRPVIAEKDRAALLLGLEVVDYVIIFDEDTPEALIHAVRPDVLVKGKDWESKQPVAGQEFIESYGGRVAFMRLEEGLSTTSIIEKIKNSYGSK